MVRIGEQILKGCNGALVRSDVESLTVQVDRSGRVVGVLPFDLRQTTEQIDAGGVFFAKDQLLRDVVRQLWPLLIGFLEQLFLLHLAVPMQAQQEHRPSG